MIRKYWVGAGIIIVLLAFPLIKFQNSNFVGTDDAAVTLVQGIDTTYKPWFVGVKLFDSPEIASTLFALQAAIGASVIGYYVGYSKGKKSSTKE